jgi:hypothetical protein
MTDLPTCKLCGGEAIVVDVPPDESMHSGWATIRCVHGDQSYTAYPHAFKPSFVAGETFWHVNARALSMARDEVKRRWVKMNERG